MKEKDRQDLESSICSHMSVKQERGFSVCQDCGEVLGKSLTFDNKTFLKRYSESQRDYERKIKSLDLKAKQDPNIAKKYKDLRKKEIWYRDPKESYREQREFIGMLGNLGIDVNINKAKFQRIKDRYFFFNKHHRETYQNMVIIFLAIFWMEIKETSKSRIEEFIEACVELGHKINKKMLNNAMLKVKKTEKKQKKMQKLPNLEVEIKNKIKILFQKDINGIPFELVKNNFPNNYEYEKLKIEMQLLADEFLNKISHDSLKNLNHKAFTAGLIYYISQTLSNRKIFTQKIIEEATKFSSTTIRKKYNILKEIIGDPKNPKERKV